MFALYIYRYGTEKNYYKKEAIKEAEKIEKYRQEGKDEHDIRKQVNIFCVCVIVINSRWRWLIELHQY